MSTGFEWLTQGNIFQSFFQPFESIGIPGAVIVSLLILGAGMIIYIKNRSIMTLATTFIVILPIILSSMTNVKVFGQSTLGSIIVTIVVIGVTFAIYRFFIRKEYS